MRSSLHPKEDLFLLSFVVLVKPSSVEKNHLGQADLVREETLDSVFTPIRRSIQIIRLIESIPLVEVNHPPDLVLLQLELEISFSNSKFKIQDLVSLYIFRKRFLNHFSKVICSLPR